MNHPTLALFELAAQTAAADDDGVVGTLFKLGPPGISILCLMALKYVYSEKNTLEKDRHLEIVATNEKHAKEKQELNDKILTVSQETNTAVQQVREAMREIVQVLRPPPEESAREDTRPDNRPAVRRQSGGGSRQLG